MKNIYLYGVTLLRVNKSLPVVQTDVDEIYSRKESDQIRSSSSSFNGTEKSPYETLRFSQNSARNSH